MQSFWLSCLFTLIITHYWPRSLLCDGTESPILMGVAHDMIDCQVEFNLDIPEKPARQHKAPPLSSHHPQAPVLSVGVYQWVRLQCTCCCTPQEENIKRTAARVATLEKLKHVPNSTLAYEEPIEPPGLLQYHIISTNGHVIVPTERRKLNLNTYGHVTLKSGHPIRTAICDQMKTCIELYSPIDCENVQNDSHRSVQTQGFYLYADNLGHSDIRAQLIWVAHSARPIADMGLEDESGYHGDGENRSSSRNALIDRYTRPEPVHWPVTNARIFVPGEKIHYYPPHAKTDLINQTGGNQTLFGRWEDYIAVTILLRPQKFYLAADWSAALIAFMIAISVGCCNDPLLMRACLKRPKPILVGLVCQLMVVPLVSIGIGSWFGLSEDQAYGLFVVATVPGGGLAYLFSYLVNGERHLTAALSLITSIVDTATSALWTFGVGWYWFQRPMQMGKAIGWLLLIAFGQGFGTVMRGCRPCVAHAILTWITRPLLLLAGILMVTLGVYINHYAFAEFNQNLILSLLLLITCGFTLGWIAGQATGQDIAIIRTLATEAAVFNGLLCIPLLRTTVHAPEGDLAAIVAVWATFLAPIPLVYHAIVSVLHHWLTDYCQRRKNEKEQNGISAIIANATGNGNELSDLGATSVAAVAAAAIAVAPAIAAGPKEPQSRRSQVKSRGSGTEVSVNNSDCGPGEVFRTDRDSTSRIESENIPLTQTVHDLMPDRSTLSATACEHDIVKQNAGRMRNHISGPVKLHKLQSQPPKITQTEDQMLPYTLSDYDFRSTEKTNIHAQAHRYHDESAHVPGSTKPSQDRHKPPPPYTNL